MQPAYAYAVVHDSPPGVYFAENIEVLSEVLAREVISQTPSTRFERNSLEEIREALLDRQWGEALEIWTLETGIVVDVFESGDVWTENQLNSSSYHLTVQKSPIFKGSNA